MILTDTHCHLDLENFDDDRDEVIYRAQEAGLVRILIPGMTVASSRSVVKLADSLPMLFAAVGVHPNDADTWDGRSASALGELAAGNLKVVAVGEVGLDYYWKTSSPEIQNRILQDQLNLAADLGLPVVLHSREESDAETGTCSKDLLEMLKNWTNDLRNANNTLAERPGVLHSFSGSLDTAERAIELGFYIGVTGPVTFKKAESKRRMIGQLPLERLLIETDSPFLAPHPHRGKRNEPAFVAHIADKIAEIKSRTPQEVAAATTDNAARLFSWGEIV